ncbi:MAG: type VI secretion system baseplate subunit TssG [Fibrobacteria bacterium]|nr:type VI secretion system baseplate subunit TssG [Fibrobacteria bacterium]
MRLSVKKRLFSQGWEFSFFQAVALLEHFYGDIQKPDSPVRFSTSPSIAFPSSDISAIEQHRECIRLISDFSGLYGVSSPLPSYFTTPVCQNNKTGQMLRAFYDLFSHRLYQLLYLAWKKGRIFPMRNGHADMVSSSLYALSGRGLRLKQNGESQSSPMSEWNQIFFTGFYFQRNGSAQNLAKLISLVFDLPRVSISQFTSRWIQNPRRMRLGDISGKLGQGYFLGERIKDNTGAFTIIIGPLDYAQAKGFLPQQASSTMRSRYRELLELVDGFLQEPLDYSITFLLDLEKAPRPVLGADSTLLGQTAWLGKPTGKTMKVEIKR